jgi:hypothetical protein
MSTRRLVAWITILAVFAMAARISVDTDTWWHLRAGQWIAENRAVPQTDSFSYTRAGESWQYPGWLVELPMYWIYRALGPGGLNLWTAAMVALAFVFIWKTLSGGSFLRAFVIVLAAAASGVYWAARPYLVTFVLTAAFLWILEDFRWDRHASAKKRLWLLPALMVIWANSHGGFAVGFLIFGAYFAGFLLNLLATRLVSWRTGAPLPAGIQSTSRDLRMLTIIGLLLVLAVCINPSGVVMLAYPFKTVSIGALQDYIQEWQSPDFHSLQVQPFAWLIFLTLGAVGVSRRRLALTDFLLVTGFAYMGLLAGRNVALFALVAPAVITRHAAPVLSSLGRRLGWQPVSNIPANPRLSRLNLLILVLLGLAVVAKSSLVFPQAENVKFFQTALPLAAIDRIREERPAGRLFNSYNWGGYLLWALPDYPVFIDGRTDLYNQEIIDQWLQVVRAEEGWKAVLDRWQVRLILLEPNMPLIEHLGEAGWNLIFADDLSVLYGR